MQQFDATYESIYNDSLEFSYLAFEAAMGKESSNNRLRNNLYSFLYDYSDLCDENVSREVHDICGKLYIESITLITDLVDIRLRDVISTIRKRWPRCGIVVYM